ncbi:MAG: SDR family NAD(P)-dependent oxidoreductase, partial [Bdellovibrionota bacterium]
MKTRITNFLITGASDGIGAALARTLARRGYSLGLVARRGELLEQVAADCRLLGAPRVAIGVVDVADFDRARAEYARLDVELGGVGGFVANAGIAADGEPKRDDGQVVRKVMAVNVVAAMDGIEFFKPRMVARGFGILAGVTSVAAARGLPLSGPYSASKAALFAYLESLRADVYPYGVSVVNIAPGFIDTPMTKGNPFKMPFLARSDQAAELFADDLLAGQ